MSQNIDNPPEKHVRFQNFDEMYFSKEFYFAKMEIISKLQQIRKQFYEIKNGEFGNQREIIKEQMNDIKTTKKQMNDVHKTERE